MNQFHFIKLFAFVMSLMPLNIMAQIGAADGSFVINSKILSEKISITIYDTFTDDRKAIIYITDGQKMIDNGALERIKLLTAQGKIPKAYYVFVSTIDAETNEDKRNTYFFCNDDYVKFFKEELVSLVEGSHLRKPKHRSLIGISFGGLSAAYFSGKTTLFENYALLSPIMYPCKEALSSIAFTENKNLNIFISTGKNDAENYVEPLRLLYKSKGYRIKNVVTEGAHDFENWSGQWEIILNYFDNENN